MKTIKKMKEESWHVENVQFDWDINFIGIKIYTNLTLMPNKKITNIMNRKIAEMEQELKLLS